MRRSIDGASATSTTNPRGGDPDGMVAESGPAPKAMQGLGLAPLLLTEEQAAELLSISPRKVWELAAAGAIPFVKIGTLKRYRTIDLQDWVERGCPATRD
jgi:excisionase family DNA binding protein